MTASAADETPLFDEAWLNDRSEFQQNFVHGLQNPVGLHIQYRLDRSGPAAGEPDADPPGHLIVADWIADERHMGFPGIVHGGLIGAILDDAMGRCAALCHRWVVTGRLDTRFRAAAPIGEVLRIEAWMTRYLRRLVSARARILLPDGSLVAEATGTYLPLTPELERRMVADWPGFAEYLRRERRQAGGAG
jgi:acyl-coenzyme A thioesterase PaaI-like protein